MGIFKACDVRGVYGDDLTDDVVYRIGRALGTLSGGKDVIVGGDVRTSTPALKSSLIAGIVHSGGEVLDIGTVPTPAFYFAKHHYGVDVGAMVTASHNPPEYNGLKISIGSLPITEDELQYIKQIVKRGQFAAGAGIVRSEDIRASYISFIQSLAPKAADKNSIKVVLDCGNGCYSGLASVVFRDFGYHTEALFCIPDGTFPNRSPNSAVPENLRQLSKKVRDTGAHIGVAFDGDGDRVAFTDHRGQFLSGDKTIILLASNALSRSRGGKVVYDIKCSSAVAEEIREASGIPIPERSGYTFIKTRMMEENAVFGGELSGHYFHRELNGGDDGLYTALVMAHMVANGGQSLSEMAREVFTYPATPDIRIPYMGPRQEVIERIANAFPPECVSRLDGVRVQFPEGWGLARASVTEPVITFRFEGRTRAVLRQIIEQFLEAVPNVREMVVPLASDMGRNVPSCED